MFYVRVAIYEPICKIFFWCFGESKFAKINGPDIYIYRHFSSDRSTKPQILAQLTHSQIYYLRNMVPLDTLCRIFPSLFSRLFHFGIPQNVCAFVLIFDSKFHTGKFHTHCDSTQTHTHILMTKTE